MMIRHCRMPTFGGSPPFNWAAIESKLSIHKMWTPEIERGLDLCERITRSIESREIEDERLREKARAQSERNAKRRR